jgi:hypothetical protein
MPGRLLCVIFPMRMAKRKGKKCLLLVQFPNTLAALFSELGHNCDRSPEAVIAHFMLLGLTSIKRQPNLLRILTPSPSTGKKGTAYFIKLHPSTYRLLILFSQTCDRGLDDFIGSLCETLWDYHRDFKTLPKEDDLIRKINFELTLRFTRLRA